MSATLLPTPAGMPTIAPERLAAMEEQARQRKQAERLKLAVVLVLGAVAGAVGAPKNKGGKGGALGALGIYGAYTLWQAKDAGLGAVIDIPVGIVVTGGAAYLYSGMFRK